MDDDGPDGLDSYREPAWFSLSIEDHRRLPRHPDYRYELIEGRTVITPRPRSRHARIATDARIDDPVGTAIGMPKDLETRALARDDAPGLHALFAAALSNEPPFASLDEARRLEAATVAVARTLDGRDGALVEDACTVASDGPGRPFGACLVTRAPDARAVPVPMRGRPHLTWIAVAPVLRRRGVGTAMLRRALGRLRDADEPVLFSTFHVGNGASALWHWDNGFALEPNPYSMRRLRDDEHEHG